MTAVVIVHFDRPEVTERLVDHLLAMPVVTGVVAVDNAIADAERAPAIERDRFVVLRPARNDGFGAGANEGMRAAWVAWPDAPVLLLNPDVWIDADAIETMLGALAADPSLGAVAPILRDQAGGIWFAGGDVDRWGVPHQRRPAAGGDIVRLPPGGFLTGACLMLAADCPEAAFDPSLFLYWEDVDLSWRIAESGRGLAVAPKAAALHDRSGPGGRAKEAAPHKLYFEARNRIVVLADHQRGPLGRWPARQAGTVRYLIRGLRAAGPRRSVTAARFYLRGVRDARHDDRRTGPGAMAARLQP